MKCIPIVPALSVLLIAATSLAQEPVVRIALVNSNIPSGAILKAINEHCPGMVLTVDPSKATLHLEAQINKESESRTERSWLTLFNSDGDAVYATDTHGTGNAVKDVCEFLKRAKK